MRVLIATQYFTPEVTAAAPRAHAFATGLAARGHDVEVIAEVPSHPEGVVHDGFRRRPVVRRDIDGFRVSHVWVRASPKKGARVRMLNYASFAASAALFGSAMRRADVVFASSPPLPVGAVGATLAMRHRAPWVLDVRDLWPEVAVLVGELSPDGRITAMAERLERRLYRSAAAITTVTRPFAEKIAQRGGGEKVSVIANGTTRTWLDAAELEPDRGGLGLPTDRFIWTYAGNMGLAQGLGAAIDAAGELGEGFTLVLLGEGPLKAELAERAAALPAGSVIFRDAVPPGEAALMMRAADALLVPLAAWPGLEGFVPSKLFDCCAVGRPTIVATPGEANRLADAAGAGLTVAPESGGEIAAAVRRLAADEELRDTLSRAGRAFAAENERDRGVERLEVVLSAVIGARRQVPERT